MLVSGMVEGGHLMSSDVERLLAQARGRKRKIKLGGSGAEVTPAFLDRLGRALMEAIDGGAWMGLVGDDENVIGVFVVGGPALAAYVTLHRALFGQRTSNSVYTPEDMAPRVREQVDDLLGGE